MLDSNHGFTTFVIKNCRNRVMHNVVKETLTELCSKFLLVKRRQAVQKVLHNCVTCCKCEGEPYKAPSSPPLPNFGQCWPFVRKGSHKEDCICLHTCCVTRSGPLDMVPELTPHRHFADVFADSRHDEAYLPRLFHIM